jgi:hypothetical protein
MPSALRNISGTEGVLRITNPYAFQNKEDNIRYGHEFFGVSS